MRTDNKAVDNVYQAEFTQDAYGTPVRRLTTSWLPCHLGFFRIDLSIIRPKPEQSKCYLALSDSQSQRMSEAFSNIIEFLKKELR